MSAPNRAIVNAPVVIDYWVREPEPGVTARGLAILLHGFSMNGEKVFAPVAPVFPPDWIVFSPNAPFPFPVPTKKPALKLGYSWYIYDRHTDEYVIDPSIPVSTIVATVEKLGWANLPKKIFGFSQGGYLGPLLAQSLRDVRQVIGLGCGYLPDELDAARPVRVDALHGTADEVIGIEGSRQSHARLIGQPGWSGSFREIPAYTHWIDTTIRPILEETLALAPV